MLLAPEVFREYGDRHGMRLEKPFEFGVSYANTLRYWLNNFTEVQEDVAKMGFDDKFMRLWRLYLEYCEGAFRAERINVGHYLLEK